MTGAEAQIVMLLINIAATKGLPALIRFTKKIKGDEPTLEDIKALHDNFEPLTEDDFK